MTDDMAELLDIVGICTIGLVVIAVLFIFAVEHWDKPR